MTGTPTSCAGTATLMSEVSKGGTLEFLSTRVRACRTLPLVRFRVTDWKMTPTGVLTTVAEQAWGSGRLIVRSGATDEDQMGQSLAGRYLSVANVVGEVQLASAIDAVCDSLSRAQALEEGEFFVQPMLGAASAAGVAFTADPRTGALYYVFETNRGDSTDVVTSGRAHHADRYVHAAAGDPLAAPVSLQPTIAALEELKTLLPDLLPLDVEFATTRPDDVVIFQARHLQVPDAVQVDLATVLPEAEQETRRILTRVTGGAPTMLSRMADWNPAEMIGIRPRPLSASLYKDLITDETWARSRVGYGFHSQVGHHLMATVLGHPFIDVERSFHSFIPDIVSRSASVELVDHYLQRLRKRPDLHDKIEFDVAVTGLVFDLPDRLAQLHAEGVSQAALHQLEEGLRKCLVTVLDERGPWYRDLKEGRRLHTESARYHSQQPQELLRAALKLLDNCRRWGSLPFAGLARAAFLATGLIHSLQSISPPIFSQDEFAAILSSTTTVSTTMQHDLRCLTKKSWLERYGHLRPGTYDICSARYDQDPKRYLPIEFPSSPTSHRAKPHVLSAAHRRRINALLEQFALPIDAEHVLQFFRRAVTGRERGKFLMAKHISEFLSALSQAGPALGVDDDALSYLTVPQLRQAAVAGKGSDVAVAEAVARSRHRFTVTTALHLPDLLSDPQQVWSHTVPPARPAFVTLGRVVARPAVPADPDLHDRAVFVEAADPGFDYLFTQGVAALVTKYGGPNSHMAVRANELGLPAVLGAGEVLFEQWQRAQCLLIDCAAERVEVLVT